MECQNCAFHNPSDAKFCQNCGQPLARPCPNCGTPNEAGAKFCKNCGHRLAGAPPTDPGFPNLSSSMLSADPRHTRLAAAAPAPLVEKARAAAHLAGERRMVTALFADVVGSTALAEQMDPEDWTALMNRAFDLLVPVVYRYEGTLARLMGDALLAFFGAPVAHEDDPVRAVRAGLDLLETTREYAREVRRERGFEFAIRVGLNTGLVVVGAVGSDLVYEYTAMGDAVNLAARMQAAARPMSILIAENTYRFVAPVFECLDVGEIEVKGKRAPVHAYEVVGPKADPGKLRGVSGLESPLVARQAELSALLELWAALRAGLGRAALLMAEAGLGKTRLVAEWKDAVFDPTGGGDGVPAWVEGHCLSYGQGLAYHLVVDLLRDLLGLPASADERQTRQALRAFCEDLLGASGAMQVYPYLGHLLSLKLEAAAEERVNALNPQALQRRYVTALSHLLTALSARQPVVIVLDDIHWADPSSVEVLGKLLPLASAAPLLFCALTRPDREAPGWQLVTAMRETMGAGLTEINLSPLAEGDTRQLISNLLEIEALPEEVRQVILNKAEGNPFFVEEVIRMLIDQGGLVQKDAGWMAARKVESVDIPDTLHGLLLARIDRLPEEVKRTLRVAAVIGRQFPVRVLDQVLEGR